MTEKEIAYEIDDYYLKRTDGLAFETIVASGINTSKPHAKPTNKKIDKKDIILIDMGCIVNGYKSDMTRTIFVGGISEEEKNVYDLVLQNQQMVIDMLKEGASSRQIVKLVENNFKINNNYNLIHSIGHGIGLDTHEFPYVGTKIDTIFKENMIVTDEPGIYILGEFGVRIEDTLKITKIGCITLTNSDKNYIII